MPNATPFATKAAAIDAARASNSRPQTIGMKHADGRAVIVSYDEESIAELKNNGFNTISLAEQTAIDAAAARAAKEAAGVAAAKTAQEEQDEADWAGAKAWVLAAYRKNRDAQAAEAKAAADKAAATK